MNQMSRRVVPPPRSVVSGPSGGRVVFDPCRLSRCRAALVRLHVACWAPPPVRDQRGQGTVEYAIVLIGAAAVALALVAWVARSGAIGRLFDAVIGRVLNSAG